ncbi:MAG TPA: hypothetical protein VME66_10580 [Candidatus Acidoferrales bacterium]|nr:hypothetical protein [Candidatus Acidoferrales bacterium]
MVPPADESESTAQIAVSGSTNTAPVTVAVSANGSAVVTTAQGVHTATLSETIVATFFSDLAEGQPLSGLPVPTACAKPVSFATTITVSTGSEVSPDLTCPASAVEQNLRNDVNSILSAVSAA